MNLKERYSNKANSLLGKLDEETEEECCSNLKHDAPFESEEEVRAAQDNPENNGEEEMAGSRNDRAYEILDSIFFNDAQAMLDSIVKALSDDQANEIFDYIERMHQ